MNVTMGTNPSCVPLEDFGVETNTGWSPLLNVVKKSQFRLCPLKRFRCGNQYRLKPPGKCHWENQIRLHPPWENWASGPYPGVAPGNNLPGQPKPGCVPAGGFDSTTDPGLWPKMNFLTLIKKFGTRFVVMLRWRSIFHHEKGVAISFELRTRLTQFSFGIPVVNLLRPLNLWFNLVDWFQFVSGFSSTDLSFVCSFDSVHPSRYFHIKETRWILQNLFFTGTTSSPLLLLPPPLV